MLTTTTASASVPRCCREVSRGGRDTQATPGATLSPCCLLLAGWWFDACGLSNLNGIYYPARHNIRKLNGIRWHHFQGPSYSLKGTRMLIRPASF